MMRKLDGLGVSAAILACSISLDAMVSIAPSTPRIRHGCGRHSFRRAVDSAHRVAVMALVNNRISFREANRLILAASTLNLFLPSKLGDLAKGHVMSKRHGMTGLSYASRRSGKGAGHDVPPSMGRVRIDRRRYRPSGNAVFLLPVAGLCAVLILFIWPLRIVPLSLAFRPDHAWQGREASESHRQAGRSSPRISGGEPSHAIAVIGLSVLIWGAHLFQFWLFSQALHGNVPILENAAFATLAILVGLLPFTFAGVGTRDAAIVFFYAPYLPLKGSASRHPCHATLCAPGHCRRALCR